MVLIKIKDYCIKVDERTVSKDQYHPPKFTMTHNMHSSPVNPQKKLIIVDDSDSATESETDYTSGMEWPGPENQLGLEQESRWEYPVNMEVAVEKNGKIKQHERRHNTEISSRQSELRDSSQSGRRSQQDNSYQNQCETVLRKPNEGE